MSAQPPSSSDSTKKLEPGPEHDFFPTTPYAFPDWWGECEVSPEQGQRRKIGPLGLWIERRRDEWKIAHLESKDPLADSLEGPESFQPGEIPAEANTLRIGFQNPSNRIQILPCLADRAIVTRPDHPFHIPPGESTVLFIGTTLWISIRSIDGKKLLELPTSRPSDTWFGPATREGELCYAGRTFCRLHIDDVPLRPHRAVTRVSLENRADDELVLDQLKLPVNNLSLFRDPGARLWTQDLAIVRQDGGDFARIDIRKQPPSMASRPNLVSPARVPQSDNALARVLGSIFSSRNS